MCNHILSVILIMFGCLVKSWSGTRFITISPCESQTTATVSNSKMCVTSYQQTYLIMLWLIRCNKWWYGLITGPKPWTFFGLVCAGVGTCPESYRVTEIWGGGAVHTCTEKISPFNHALSWNMSFRLQTKTKPQVFMLSVCVMLPYIYIYIMGLQI